MYYAPRPAVPPRRVYPRSRLAQVAAKKGALIGFVVSVGYGLSIFLVIGLRERAAIADIGALLGFTFFPISLIAGLPCAVLGAWSGSIIGHMLQRRPPPVSAPQAMLSGIKVALTVIVVLNSLLGWLPFGPLWNYLMLLGGPSLIYLFVAAMAAYRLNACTVNSPDEISAGVNEHSSREISTV